MAQAADPDTALTPPLKVIHVGRDLRQTDDMAWLT